ncbi:MAG: kelch repeat-containing protein [Planctomycetota bacterium]
MRIQHFLVTAALAAAVPAQSWAQLSLLTTFPTVRRSGAAAFEVSGNRLIFLGGVSPTPSVILPETWRFNGTWQLLAPPGGTTGRWGHQLVQNTVNNRLLAFGGRSPTISGFANDTIEWTGTAWVNVPSPTAPSPRYLYGMVFDSRRARFVLVGGRTATQTLGDVWEFDGAAWTQRTFAVTPSPRAEMAMAYDPVLGQTILFGGIDNDTNTVLGDTWFYDGATWVAQTPAASPDPRYRAASAYDSVRKRMVLFGGFDGAAIRNDTHEFTGETWTAITTGPTVPAATTETLHGYDPVRRKFVLFGGFGTSGFSSQTWEYTGATTGLFSRFGSGCATSAGEPTIESNIPRIGQNWDLTFNSLPLDMEFVLVALGLSNQSFGAVPLPFDLGLIGLGGCNLLVSADVVNVVDATLIPGTALHTLAIPNNTALVNAVVFAQGILFDLVLPDFFFIGTTKGGRAVVGS